MISRSKARNLRAAVTALSSVGAKGLVGVISLLSIRLTLGYLGPERFGLWMTIASLQAVFSFCDFGLGNGVLNTVAEAYGRGDRALISRAIRSALAMQAMVATALLILFWLTFRYVNWSRLFHVAGTDAAGEAGPAILIFASLLLVRSVVQVVQQAQLGLQGGYVANAWTAGGNLAAVVGLYVAAARHAGVPLLCLVVSGLPVIAGLLNATWWLATRLPRAPGPAASWWARRDLLAEMLRTGMFFFFLQLAAQLNFGIDPLIVNQVIGSAAVSTLAVVQKPFDMLSIFLLLMLQPLWPAYREAVTSGDISWVRSTFRRALAASLALAILFAAVMALKGQELIRLWAGPTARPGEALILAYCVAHLFSASQSPFAFFLNGLGKIRFQLILAIPVIMVSMLMKILLTPRFGLVAIPASTVCVGIALMLPSQILYIRRTFKQLDRHQALAFGEGRGINVTV